MNYVMPEWLAFLVRTFPGIKGYLKNLNSINKFESTIIDGVIFPFDKRFMDEKRFIAIAAGAVEKEEINTAKKYISNNDIVVELGAGLGISAARINKLIKPKKHICFEANPTLIPYLKNLFKINKLDIELKNIALGDNKKIKFYALNDYILSSFSKPINRNDFFEIEVETISLQKIIDEYLPTVIFCDIEGAELLYLDAINFKTVGTIILELHPNIYGSAGINKIFNRFNNNGFSRTLKSGHTYCFLKK